MRDLSVGPNDFAHCLSVSFFVARICNVSKPARTDSENSARSFNFGLESLFPGDSSAVRCSFLCEIPEKRLAETSMLPGKLH